MMRLVGSESILAPGKNVVETDMLVLPSTLESPSIEPECECCSDMDEEEKKRSVKHPTRKEVMRKLAGTEAAVANGDHQRTNIGRASVN